MKVVYTAPNRAHHYIYAKGLFQRGVLSKFISGFSRLSPRAKIGEPNFPIIRADILQTLYLLSLRLPLGVKLKQKLSYLAKLEQDYVTSNNLKGADIVVFYNGCGLRTIKKAKSLGVISVVEAVNSHVKYQEKLLREEYQNLQLNWMPFYKPEVERRVKEYDQADYILTPSEFVRNSFLEMGYEPEKLLKVPFGFKKMEVVSTGTVSEPFRVLYVGSVSVRKGLRYLIEAFKMLDVENKELVIVGPKSEITGIEDLQIPENVFFTGVLKGDDLIKEYFRASVFCLPTIEEGLALVIGEALSFGLPVVTTENSGALDVLEHGKEGFIVPIKSAKDIMQRLDELASNSGVLLEMSKNARELALSLDGWDQSVSLLETTLRKLGKNAAKVE